jgi:hypothetical protein
MLGRPKTTGQDQSPGQFSTGTTGCLQQGWRLFQKATLGERPVSAG